MKPLKIDDPKTLVGMRLEARDLKNPTMICVASIANVRPREGKNPEIEITFDGWGNEYNYWTVIGY